MKILLAAAILVIPSGTISADDAPALKDGLCSINTQFTEHPSEKRNEIVTAYCRNRAHDDGERAASKQGANCKTISDKTLGTIRTTETQCTASDTVINTRFTLTVISDSATHTETVTTFNPPSAGRTGTTIITDQKYVGACPAGFSQETFWTLAARSFIMGSRSRDTGGWFALS
jgi:hypothetical protein